MPKVKAQEGPGAEPGAGGHHTSGTCSSNWLKVSQSYTVD